MLKDHIWILSTFIATISVVSFDVYHYLTGPSKGLNSPDTYSRYLIPVYVMIFLAYLIKNFLNTLRESEYLNRNLEEKITEKAKKIEKVYQEKREFEIREAELLEKQRIYKDLHDDVGSKLVSIIHSNNEEAGKSIAKSALEYLRNSVSQVNKKHVSISKTFEQICEETQIRCAGAGLVAKSNVVVNDNIQQAELTANIGYHLTRIIREGITNVIKHTNATHIFLEITLDERSLSMKLSDNGKNFTALSEFGTGTSNMQYRSEELGGTIQWHKNEDGGCDVTFYLEH